MGKESEWALSIVRRLRAEGWRERWGRSGHVVFDSGDRMVTIPVACKEDCVGTYRAITRRVGVR